MKFKLYIVTTVLVLSTAVQGEEKVPQSRLTHAKEWSLWKLTHKRTYETEREELDRHLVWLSNKKYIDLHNANAHIFGFTLAMNQFGDLTDVEYAQRHTTTYAPVSEALRSKFKTFSIPEGHNLTYPDSLDWRTKGAVGQVKNQLLSQCSSSYAFSAIAALEGAWALATSRFVSLSEQNIIDCSVPYGNHGCSGGNTYNSFMYIIANNGVDTEDSYQYRARQSQCGYNTKYTGASMSGIVNIKFGDEESLLAATAGVGPISVNIDASTNAFRFYYSGVFDSSQCSSTNLNHAMVVTGFGTLNNKKYWLLKNSWGDTWGASGYIMMSRDKYNQCGIATAASYPTL